jgi:branched-chain amino acid aminotransferase
MGASSVSTFSWASGALHSTGSAPSLAEAQAALPDGSYTTFRTYKGRSIVRLEQHRRRLLESVGLGNEDDLLPRGTLRRAVTAALDATGHDESRVRVTFAPPALHLCVEAFSPMAQELRQKGAACITVLLHRDQPHAKDTRFALTASRLVFGLPTGIHEALLVDVDDSILEGLSSNFFALVDGVLHSEAERALLGVTRSLVLEIARDVTAVREEAIRRTDLPRTTECFITSVSREVLPVTRIDAVPVGGGVPGPLTTEIARRFAELVAGEAETL